VFIMKRFLFAAAAVAGLVAGVASATQSADAAGIRLLNFEAGEFSNVVAGGGAHYYLTYSLTNPREEATRPKLRIELRTDTEMTYGDHFDARTSTAVAEVTGNDDYKPASKIRAESLDGGAAVQGLAHFGRIDPNADGLEVRVYGLFDPVWRDRKGNVFSERHVLVLNYKRQGDEYNRQDDPIHLVSSSQETEGEPVLLSSAE
jgi:hypothetical protein